MAIFVHATSLSAYLGMHAASVPLCSGTYISIMVVFTIVVSMEWLIAVLQDIANRVAYLILMARPITKISCEFLMYRKLPNAICRH